MSSFETRVVTVRGESLRLAIFRRAGSGVPILFLHGFGSTKEEYVDIRCLSAFDGRSVLAFDFPGFGESSWHASDSDAMGFFRDVTASVLDSFGFDRVHIVGHSMGGLTGLLLASDHPDRVESLTSIEGNLAPEDCFMSRQILAHPAREDDVFLDRLAERMRTERICGHALYAASLARRVDSMAVRPILTSIIRWSERGELLEKFKSLSMPRMFIHGSSNRTLSYLPELACSDVRLQEIPQSGHFPMYSNPVGMWNALGSFLVPDRSAA